MLNIQEVTADGATPERWLAVLHGIYGAGRNWSSVARAVAAARPEWGAILVDLRQHGESLGFQPPHTLAAAAKDLDEVMPPAGLRAVLGHSFGGKVALLHAAGRDSIEEVWVIDSTPDAGPPEGSAWGMLEILKSLPQRFEDRDDAVDALVARGVTRPIALWMTTNLVRTGDAYRWRIEPDDMEALLRDFYSTDLWEVVESPREGLRVHFVRATESPVLSDEAAARIRAASSGGSVFLHEIGGGHWVNAENPDALVELLVRRLGRSN